MKKDIIDRLSSMGEGDIYLAPHSTRILMDEAADEIERLRVALEEYVCSCYDRDKVAAGKRRCFQTDCGAPAFAALYGEKQDE